ncbi:MAG: ribosome maturation factor RimP [Bacteroides sp.]|nr:ribosome maturation factor RimP [Prevotella sp.]MCM1407969.1 ribosome maturation factor RimP [Treponema brennaborense]MCM1469711.1 ribosome maturation factor RimP [Bacteroides sp.]
MISGDNDLEYIALDELPYYKECSPLVSGLGYALVELRLSKSKTQHNVSAVIARADPSSAEAVGVNDCAKVHRLLLPRLEALLHSQDVFMEVMSPGMERNIKNAAEFVFFTGKSVRVWSKDINDWIPGKIVSSGPRSVVLDTAEKGTLTIPYEQIAKAKLLQL